MTITQADPQSSQLATDRRLHFTPSVHLPSLKQRPPLPELAQALAYLGHALRLDGHEDVYVSQPVQVNAHGNAALDKRDLVDPIQAKAQGSTTPDDNVSEDEDIPRAENLFELRHARSWLSALIKSGLGWVTASANPAEEAAEEVTVLLDRATELLSACAGKSGEFMQVQQVEPLRKSRNAVC